MKIYIQPSIIDAIPNFKVAVIQYNKSTVSDSPQMLKGRLQLFQEQLFFELEERDLNDVEGIQEWRTILQTLGADPLQHKTSVETMYRQIREQLYVETHSSAIDLNTLFSLQYGIPSGMYNSSVLVGDIQFTIGQEDDGYEALNNKFSALSTIPILKDGYSPFGSPYVDSVRSAITEETRDILHILFLKPSMSVEDAQQLADACGSMFISMNGGDASATILHAGQQSMEAPYLTSSHE